ncbi:hypothetical protein TRIHO_04990 [Tritonibacter horizontis]|uniref:TfoX N-terminal domain-containing protein n=1 Tax=Tritonibacter horizontis TaxID=1768241 RepID=A0A132C1X5_9RHOB|nr:hypothetical protein TRIHO_04990 [Tritonibacter horizontis]
MQGETTISDPEQAWQDLVLTMMSRHAGMARGQMMSADALLCREKVFAFFSKRGGGVGLGARVGRDADIDAFGISDWQHLAPFKTKPPMKDWIVIGIRDHARWHEIAEFAYRTAIERP